MSTAPTSQTGAHLACLLFTRLFVGAKPVLVLQSRGTHLQGDQLSSDDEFDGLPLAQPPAKEASVPSTEPPPTDEVRRGMHCPHTS